MSDPDLIAFLKAAYPNGSWPRPFHVLEGLQKIASGISPKDAAKAVGTSTYFLKRAQESPNPEFDVLGINPSDVTDDDLRRAAVGVSNLTALSIRDYFSERDLKIIAMITKS